MTQSPADLPWRYGSSPALLMTHSTMLVPRRPALKSRMLPWMVLMASWAETVIMEQLLTMTCDRENTDREDRRFERRGREQGPGEGASRVRTIESEPFLRWLQHRKRLLRAR